MSAPIKPIQSCIDPFTGRPVVDQRQAFAKDGQAIHVRLLLSDAAGNGSEQPTQARSLIFDYSDPRTWPQPAVASSEAISQAYADRSLALADAWRDDGSTGAPLKGDTKALRDAALALRDAAISNAWREQD